MGGRFLQLVRAAAKAVVELMCNASQNVMSCVEMYEKHRVDVQNITIFPRAQADDFSEPA